MDDTQVYEIPFMSFDDFLHLEFCQGYEFHNSTCEHIWLYHKVWNLYGRIVPLTLR